MSKNIKEYLMVILGGVIFAFGVNIFIVPLHLYSGGMIGIAQIIRTLLIRFVGFQGFENMDIAGIINFFINIPLMLLAYRSISRTFFVKTVVNMIAQTLAFSLIWIPQNPIINEPFAACVIGGIISGYGIGLALRNGGSGGGLDILGMYFTKRLKHFSVGSMAIIVNVVVYGLCAILFDLKTAIYSIMNQVVFSQALDKSHLQNIPSMVIIFTNKKDVYQMIEEKINRKVYRWASDSHPEYDYVLTSVMNKYEANQLRNELSELDPDALLIVEEKIKIEGKFEKRL